jgi:ABC-type nitrate/sulfonate/bicarbonate transport system substrate-binding protein
MPFGLASHRSVLLAQEKAGFNSISDFNNININPDDHISIAKELKLDQKGNINALSSCYPIPAILEEQGLIKKINENKIVKVVLMSNDFIAKNPEAPIKFLNSLRDVYDFYRNNKEKTDDWYLKEAKLNIVQRALDIATSIEPNINATSREEIYLNFTDEDYKIMQEAADFVYSQGEIKKQIQIKKFIDISYLSEIE